MAAKIAETRRAGGGNSTRCALHITTFHNSGGQKTGMSRFTSSVCATRRRACETELAARRVGDREEERGDPQGPLRTAHRQSVCVSKIERARERVRVCVCVCARERER